MRLADMFDIGNATVNPKSPILTRSDKQQIVRLVHISDDNAMIQWDKILVTSGSVLYRRDIVCPAVQGSQ
jgi:hypothetical protein